MSPDISEGAFEEAIECGLLQFGPDAHPRRGTPAAEAARLDAAIAGNLKELGYG